MINKLSQNKGVLFLLLLLVSACTGADTKSSSTGLLDTIRQELAQGKVIVVYQMSNQESGSEQYADWSEYLNEFSSTKKAHYSFHSADQQLNRFLRQNGVEAKNAYTLFLKKGSYSYFYDGVVVEPMVYSSVVNAYSGKPLTDMDRAFLPDMLDISVE